MIRHLLATLCTLAALALAPVAHAEDGPPVEVMVLGTYHFANPGRDIVNVKSDDVLAPRRQAELSALATALATWKPTKIAVERESDAPDLSLASYVGFKPADLATNRNETLQIGYRLAHRLGLAKVYGFDEQPGAGEPDYFPFDKVKAYAEAHGMMPVVDGIFAEVAREAQAMQADQENTSIAGLLLRQNDRTAIARLHGLAYNGLIAIGDSNDQPGAELNAMWFLRNAKMFAKLGLIAQPGDRVLVVVGSGHKYWLEHLVRTTPGFVLADPVPYLEQAGAASAPPD